MVSDRPLKFMAMDVVELPMEGPIMFKVIDLKFAVWGYPGLD
jgi:hypothetical protein